MSGEVYAAAVLSGHGSTEEDGRAQRIEGAMIMAAQKAGENGITDPDKVRDLMLAARAAILAE